MPVTAHATWQPWLVEPSRLSFVSLFHSWPLCPSPIFQSGLWRRGQRGPVSLGLSPSRLFLESCVTPLCGDAKSQDSATLTTVITSCCSETRMPLVNTAWFLALVLQWFSDLPLFLLPSQPRGRPDLSAVWWSVPVSSYPFSLFTSVGLEVTD